MSTIAVFVAIFAGLVLVHELGHFLTAKASGVTVKEFGIGFPPRIFSVKRGETVYSLNFIPLGGFTKLVGEEDPKSGKSLAGKPYGIRLLVLGAGSLMNIVLPLILFSAAFMIPHNVVKGQVIITEVASTTPAAQAGVTTGDTLLAIEGHSINNIGDLGRYIQLNLGEEIELLVRHTDSTEESVKLTPRWRHPAGQGPMGVTVAMQDYTIESVQEPPWQAVPMAARTLTESFVLFKNGFMGMFIKSQPGITGPVGIAQMTGEFVRAGPSPLLEFAAFLSINLAVINILPLPALDGGRIAFVLLEMARRGRRVSPRTEGLIHFIGFATLIGVIMAVTYYDILRIMGGGN